MLIVDSLTSRERSELPAGGTPGDDRAYLDWRDGWLVRVADIATIRRLDMPCDALAGWRLDSYLFARLGAPTLLFDFIYAHRLRFLAIAYRDRRREVLSLATRFAYEALTHDGR